MTDSRPAARRRRPAVDPRLLIGIVLVLASIAGVLGIVAGVDQRTTVYAAAATLTPGAAVSASDLLPRRVALEGADDLYLTDRDLATGALVATTVVRRDELVPRSAVGSRSGDDSTTLVLPVTGGVSASVQAGSLVDIWSSAESVSETDVVAPGGFAPPVVLSDDAVVVRVVEPDGLVSAADGVSVEVLVPRFRVARLLQAIANGDALAIVPAGIPLSDR